MEVETGIFSYFVGVNSLHELANRDSRVCVMNILGNESSTVTPVSHVYSGGNIVAGVQYGRHGAALETALGPIPVYGSIREVIQNGKHFETGVIYLPPTAVSHAVSEMCAHNEELKRIVIVTEKISVRDARYIRWGCQKRGVDVIGANSLGIANSWDEVRIGGALGGDKPGESLKKGTVAIYSNSGNFSTTISEYLKTGGFGTTTILSSGKDIYIHFALPEFLYAAQNDPRTECIVVYVEPGGYYEKQALDWLAEGRYKLTKPIVAIVSGRWKKNLSRAVGHAGALAGSGDDAESKEHWFDDYFGVPEFNVENPQVSELGVRVKTIQDVPEAVTAVMKKIGKEPDFEPIGDLRLKPWFVNEQGADFPPNLSLATVQAINPYDEEIERANRQVGSQYIRESMRNRSGATYMDRNSQVTHIHGHSILNLVKYPFSGISLFALTKEIPGDLQIKLINPILNYFISLGCTYTDIAQRGRNNGASPNAYIGAAVLTSGNAPLYQALQQNISGLIDLFYQGIGTKLDIRDDLIEAKLDKKEIFSTLPISQKEEDVVVFFNNLLQHHGLDTIFTRYVQTLSDKSAGDTDRPNPLLLLISAILLGFGWKALTTKQVARDTIENIGTYLALNSLIVSNSSVNPERNSFLNNLKDLENPDILETDFTSACFQILFNREPLTDELFTFNTLLNLTITNGPGTISAKGAKESVSARNHIATTYAGFMTNTGFAHGGNGFEAVEFLIKEFGDFDPYTQQPEQWNGKLESIASRVAGEYIEYKKGAKSRGELNYRKIPCSNHPVFKGKPVNVDPREEYVRDLFKKHSMVNPFLEFYHYLVVKLFDVGATRNIFCVNIDAVIATVSLELFWKQFKAGEISKQEMQDIVFTMFLFGRMVGCSAEIADHRARGTDMDCRTPASDLAFVN